MESTSKEPQSRFINKIIFLSFGIASLLGWNALLTKLDFFDHYLKDINPFTSFAFYNYILNISFQFILIWKKNIFPFKQELIAGIVGTIIFLIVLPLCTSKLGINKLPNKIVTIILIILMGFINALTSGGFFAYSGLFPLEMIVLFTVGQGLSAVLMNLLEYIVIASVNIKDEEERIVVSAWIFFSVAILILIFCLILLLYSYKDEYCLYYLNKGNSLDKNNNSKKSNQLALISPDENSDNNVDEKNNQLIKNLDDDERLDTTPTVERSFLYIFKKIWDLDILACYGYIVTFGLFPGVCLKHELFGLVSYKSVTIIFTYNLFDTIGRFLVRLMKPTKFADMIILLGRTILFFTIIFNHYCQVKLGASLTFTSIYLLANVAILGVTNGMGATLTFGLASEVAEDEIKKQTGGSIGFFSILGIFLGSCLAFGTVEIIDSYTPKKQ